MSKFTQAAIVPLIGGIVLGQQNVFGKRPEYLLSFSPFANNDSQLRNYYNNEVPYYLIDEDKDAVSKIKHVDVVASCCPCAGLSSLSMTSNASNPINDWMYKSTEFVLKNVKPEVLWGENAPRLASNMGRPVVAKLRAIGKEYGYTFSLFKTKSRIHGLSQLRERSFYFFWKGDKVPFFDWFKVESPISSADDILSVPRDPNDPMSQILTNPKTPSTDYPFYTYLLEVTGYAGNHAGYIKSLKKSIQVLDEIENVGKTYDDCAKWMRKHGHERELARSERMYKKLKSGGGVIRKYLELPSFSDAIGAFVGHYPTMLTHPTEDRFLTVRECLHMMRMPKDFQLLNPKKCLNHICQNVPVSTAEFPARMVKEYLEGKKKCDHITDGFLIQDNIRQRNIIVPDSVEINSESLDKFM
jgi:site-specific DNA-cytosine methylase